MTPAQKALEDIFKTICPTKTFPSGVENHQGRITLEQFNILRAVIADKMDDVIPCVSCGKPSQRATPDDADMCHECFGDFNATEYDNLKKNVDALMDALEPFANAYVNAECTIAQDAEHRGNHVIRATSFWLSFNHFVAAIKARSAFKKDFP